MGFHQHTYFVALVLPEPVLSRVEAFKQLIAKKFGSKACLKAPAHITLIPPFWFTDDQRVIAALRSFTWNEPIKLHLNGYGTFGKKVLYIKPEPNEKLNLLQQSIKTHFECVLELKNKKNKKLPFVPHITIGNRDWNEAQFNAARDYFNQYIPFEAICFFTSMSLLKFEGQKWQVLEDIAFSSGK
ncbi:MAG: 2'-5' RNA ligase family protein [Flavobacteriales bacterium]|nr:2'-5' RNA ligase family protein [Flavobacteriales bacterium]